MQQYLQETLILNFNHTSIRKLIDQKGWNFLNDNEKIKQIYSYVKEEIKFGYNATDDLKASEILEDGYGQCNTKSTLFMALLRAVGIPCRFHGFTIYKDLQEGALTPIAYKLAPDEIIHSWVEVYFEDRWIVLEGLILDNAYLKRIQTTFNNCSTSFCGYGIATNDLQNPNVEWEGGNTFIQSNGIARDFGLFDSPDDFYCKHGSNVKGLKKFFYSYYIRHAINRNVEKIRNGGHVQYKEKMIEGDGSYGNY